MNPIIEKVAMRKDRSIESLVENVGLTMIASAMAAEEFFKANPDGVFHDHSVYARNIIRATLEHYRENLSEGMIDALDANPTPFVALGEQVVAFKAAISQALAELDP